MMHSAFSEEVRLAFMEYLEETVYTDDIPELLEAARRTLQTFLKTDKIAFLTLWQDMLCKIVWRGGKVDRQPLRRESGTMRDALRAKQPLWTCDESTGRWSGVVPLVSGQMCWGCVEMSDAPAACGQQERQAAEKLCEYVSLQLMPLVERFNSRTTALALLQKDALIMLSEELKAPLSIAASSAQLLQRKLTAQDAERYRDEYAEFFTYLEQNLSRAIRIADDLLETGRLECGYAVPQPESFDVKEQIDEVIHSALPYAQQAGVQLTFTSALQKPLEVFSDPNYLARIVLSLLSNAMAAGRMSGEGGVVAVTLAQHGGQAAVSVRDNGPCIPREDLPHVFEKFWYSKAQGVSRPAGGGLSLYLARLLADSLGARLTVDEMAQGACFTLHLPVHSTAFADCSALRARPAAYRQDQWRQRLQIEFSGLSVHFQQL